MFVTSCARPADSARKNKKQMRTAAGRMNFIFSGRIVGAQ
jgi:hypothetical protein